MVHYSSLILQVLVYVCVYIYSSFLLIKLKNNKRLEIGSSFVFTPVKKKKNKSRHHLKTETNTQNEAQLNKFYKFILMNASGKLVLYLLP